MISGALNERSRASRHPRADGERTRAAILRAATSLATVEGLEGLSIGHLADAIGMSKSGLYAHFGSKQELQVATVEEAERVLQAEVIAPALAARPGLDQLATACEAYLSYVERRVFPGGCFMASAALEMGTRPGPVKDLIAAFQAQFGTLIRGFAATALARSKTGSPPTSPGSRRCSAPWRPPRLSSTSFPPGRPPTGSLSNCTRSCWPPTPNSSSTTTRPSWTWPARSSASG